MIVEGVVLTGGASQRMGEDKAGLLVEGVPVAVRTAHLLGLHCDKVTVLGREPIPGYAFLADKADYEGPLSALSRFVPTSDSVFVASCDLPRFDARVVEVTLSLIQGYDACLPVVGTQVQPLCGLYRATAWPTMSLLLSEGKKSMMALIERLRYRTITQEGLAASGIDVRSVIGANTPEEWSASERS
jgi:molybdopterin-guanine dinucleotide biosynthesis protein A